MESGNPTNRRTKDQTDKKNMLWTEIIVEIDAEIARLESAREILIASPSISSGAWQVATKKGSSSESRNSGTDSEVKGSSSKDSKARSLPLRSAAPGTTGMENSIAAARSAEIDEGPQVRVLAPKRRRERTPRRNRAGSGPDAKPQAALSGATPSGPVAVSADEARKAQERSAAAPSPQPETSSRLGSERTLGSLVQAYEHNARLSGMGSL